MKKEKYNFDNVSSLEKSFCLCSISIIHHFLLFVNTIFRQYFSALQNLEIVLYILCFLYKIFKAFLFAQKNLSGGLEITEKAAL